MEKIEKSFDLPKLNAVLVARNKDNLAFLKTILFEETGPLEKPEFGWYLNFKNPGPNKKYHPACVELDPEEVDLLLNNLKKALLKLMILENIKIEGFYTLNLIGIKNLRLDVKSDGSSAWLEFILYSSTHQKFVTKLGTTEIRLIHQILQNAHEIGEKMVNQLEKIQGLSGDYPKPPAPVPALEGENLARHLEVLVEKKRDKASSNKPRAETAKVSTPFWSKLRYQ